MRASTAAQRSSPGQSGFAGSSQRSAPAQVRPTQVQQASFNRGGNAFSSGDAFSRGDAFNRDGRGGDFNRRFLTFPGYGPVIQPVFPYAPRYVVCRMDATGQVSQCVNITAGQYATFTGQVLLGADQPAPVSSEGSGGPGFAMAEPGYQANMRQCAPTCPCGFAASTIIVEDV